MSYKRRSAALGFVLAVAPAALYAQAPQCSIDLGKPGQVKDANNAMAKAALFQGKPDQVIAAAKEAFGKLAKDEAKVIQQNPTGRAMVMGNAFAELAGTPDGLAPMQKAALGLGEGTIDVVAAADSMFDIVDAAGPGCKDQTEEARRKVYATLINNAVNAYNGQNVDSALALATRGLSIYDGYKLAYIAYNIQGNARQAKDDINGAAESFTKMTALMKGDTALVDERKQTMTNLANLMLGHAETLTDEGAKKAKLDQTIALLQGYLQEFPGDAKAEAALARAQTMNGDASAADRFFGAMAASPDKYSESQLFEGAVNAARAEKAKEATMLFEAGLKKNPYSRDGLFNIALTLQKLERYPDADAYLRRLVAIDPENPEAYQVFALNYQSQARTQKVVIDSLRKAALDAANDRKTTTAQKNAIAARIKADLDPREAEYKVQNDSLLKYFNRYQNAKAKVAFNLWSHDGDKHVLAGTVENLGEAQADYAVKFEFLDATGKVVAAKEAPVAAVAAKGTKAFRVEVEGAGVVAFRYAPFSGS
ncbi:MAG: hypothetical protein IT361_17960 [Gemmatimonadaceae bacterium]|nr:hypothetical protein [Gemmatimonadaceae bacterium]